MKVDVKLNTSGIYSQLEKEFKGKKLHVTTYNDGEVKIDYYKKGGIYYPGGIPRLASGGIINQPGRGVPLGIGGEAGAEGVIPLTDSQQMALLGEAIGKYININATIPVYVGNRQIAREIQKINAENDFAYNR